MSAVTTTTTTTVQQSPIVLRMTIRNLEADIAKSEERLTELKNEIDTEINPSITKLEAELRQTQKSIHDDLLKSLENLYRESKLLVGELALAESQTETTEVVDEKVADEESSSDEKPVMVQKAVVQPTPVPTTKLSSTLDILQSLSKSYADVVAPNLENHQTLSKELARQQQHALEIGIHVEHEESILSELRDSLASNKKTLSELPSENTLHQLALRPIVELMLSPVVLPAFEKVRSAFGGGEKGGLLADVMVRDFLAFFKFMVLLFALYVIRLFFVGIGEDF